MLICVHLQHRAAVGARVASTTAVEVGPGSAELGKHCGPVPGAPQGPSPTPKTSEKRAYRRARLRAAHKGGTYYRGRWHTAADLKALPYTPTPPMPRSLRAEAKETQGTLSLRAMLQLERGRIELGGLSGACLMVGCSGYVPDRCPARIPLATLQRLYFWKLDVHP